MPTIKANGVDLFYKESGRGPETIVFSHGLLMDHSMFEAQRAAFDSHYRVIAYDHRGQGQSEDPGRGYDMDILSEDAAALIRLLHADPCHFAGLSMGGFIGMRMAARRPELLRSLTLMNTGAESEPWLSRIRYNLLARLTRIVSPAPFVSMAVKELFGASTRKDPAKQSMLQEWTAKLRSRPRKVASSLLAVMNRRDVSAELSLIRCPTLVITGEEDTARPPADSEKLAEAISGARLVRIPRSGHSSSLEQPEAVIAAMRDFIESQTTSAIS
jgi:3-oxoadipate enol-lactonase